MDWQASNAFKKEKKNQFKKGKGKKSQNNFKYFNYGKLRHYVKDYYSKPKQNEEIKIKTEIPNPERKPKQKRYPGKK